MTRNEELKAIKKAEGDIAHHKRELDQYKTEAEEQPEQGRDGEYDQAWG